MVGRSVRGVITYMNICIFILYLRYEWLTAVWRMMTAEEEEEEEEEAEEGALPRAENTKTKTKRKWSSYVREKADNRRKGE